jgi:NitT/TauT family transport system permease protein
VFTDHSSQPLQRKAVDGWCAFWVIRGHLSRRIYLMFALAGMLLPLAAWWWLSGSGLMDKVFMPSPLDVLSRVYTWFNNDRLLNDMWISTYRVVIGFALSAVLAIPLGLMIGTYRLLFRW